MGLIRNPKEWNQQILHRMDFIAFFSVSINLPKRIVLDEKKLFKLIIVIFGIIHSINLIREILSLK